MFEMAERDDDRDKNHSAKMEALVQTYEKKNQELEEKELEVRYRLQMLENTMPALMMWNIWRMMMSVQTPTAGLASSPGKDLAEEDQHPPPASREEELLYKLRGLENRLNTQTRLLEESKNAEEDLKSKLKDLETMIAKEQVVCDTMDNEVDQDVELFEKLGKMAKERMEMDKRIKDLELKEKLYKETIEHADNFIAQLENKFDAHAKDREGAHFYDPDQRVPPKDNYDRKIDKDAIQDGALEDKVLALDQELQRLRDELTLKDRERVLLEETERKLLAELENAVAELEKVRGDIDEPLRAQIELSKQRSQAIEQDLKQSDEYRCKMRPDHFNEVRSLKNELVGLHRALMENEVEMNSQIQKVRNLKLAMEEMSYILNLKKSNWTKAVALTDTKEVKSLRMKFTEIVNHNENFKLFNVPRMSEVHDNLIDYKKEMMEKDIISPKGEFRFTTLHEGTSKSMNDEDSLVLTQVITEEELERIVTNKTENVKNKWKDLYPLYLTEVNATEFQAFMAMIEHDKPDDAKPVGISRKFPISKPGLPPECNVAQNAVSCASGKNVKGTIDNLTKAYQHSKGCDKCNDKLGTFLEDIIRQLGVKLPRCKELRRGEPEYTAQPSDCKSKKLGPGTISWDPKDNECGARLRPTVSALKLQIEELKQKCKTKDCMIEIMADELRSNTNFDGNRLIDEIVDYPNINAPDFDRYTLHQYINCQGANTFDQCEMDSDEHPATNPLGLKIIRQVGPDSLLIKWNPPKPNKVYAFEIYVNGMFLQRIRSPGRTKTLLHPIDLDEKVTITLNTLSYTGENLNTATVTYPCV